MSFIVSYNTSHLYLKKYMQIANEQDVF